MNNPLKMVLIGIDPYPHIVVDSLWIETTNRLSRIPSYSVGHSASRTRVTRGIVSRGTKAEAGRGYPLVI